LGWSFGHRLVDRVQASGEVAMITKDGVARAVLLSAGEFDSIAPTTGRVTLRSPVSAISFVEQIEAEHVAKLGQLGADRLGVPAGCPGPRAPGTPRLLAIARERTAPRAAAGSG